MGIIEEYNRLKRKEALYKGRIFKHLKSGNLYKFDRLVIIEGTESVGILYKDLDNPDIFWVRPYSEFFDGRFVDVGLTTTF